MILKSHDLFLRRPSKRYFCSCIHLLVSWRIFAIVISFRESHLENNWFQAWKLIQFENVSNKKDNKKVVLHGFHEVLIIFQEQLFSRNFGHPLMISQLKVNHTSFIQTNEWKDKFFFFRLELLVLFLEHCVLGS